MADDPDSSNAQQTVFHKWRQQAGVEHIDFFGDLRNIHIEVGVVAFLILILIANAIGMVVLLPGLLGKDVYVIEGVRRGGQAEVLWGVEADSETVRAVNDAYEAAQIRAIQARKEAAQRRREEQLLIGDEANLLYE